MGLSYGSRTGSGDATRPHRYGLLTHDRLVRDWNGEALTLRRAAACDPLEYDERSERQSCHSQRDVLDTCHRLPPMKRVNVRTNRLVSTSSSMSSGA